MYIKKYEKEDLLFYILTKIFTKLNLYYENYIISEYEIHLTFYYKLLKKIQLIMLNIYY